MSDMMRKNLETLNFIHGRKNKDLTEEDAHKLHDLFVEIIEWLNGRKYPKKFNSLTEVKMLSALCEASMQEAIDNRTKIPMTLNITDNGDVTHSVKLNAWSFLCAEFLDEGKSAGLSGKPLLHYVNDRGREMIDTIRASLKQWDEQVAPHINKVEH